MFSSAFKSISATNITANYSIAPSPTSTAGPWKIYDAKKKSTGKAYSVFVFDKKSLDSHSNSLGKTSASAHKRAVDEVVERLKKEASSLAKLRHPSILELVEPVEETRSGGLQFATEAVTASLASVLHEKDDQERSGGRSSRYVTEDSDGTRRRRELEIDELEIQKGLLQISKALEFLHENAGLVHGNLTPSAVLINSKSDWKISGLAFCSPPDNSSKPTSIQGISLHEVLNMDPRLPKLAQMDLDFTSPDFVMDNNLNVSADMFSLGLLSIALYNSPHQSPLECHGSVSSYKRLFSSSSSVPSPSNNYLSSRPIPKDLASNVLPRLVTRRPAQRLTAREFQESEYFDNILVSTIRFLDSFPAKTHNEKSSFLRGLNKVLPSFPKSVMEKKLLPALLDELKDRELLSLILQNVFKIMSLLPAARRPFGEKVRPALKEIFVTNAKQSQEKDASRDAGLMVFLENVATVAEQSSGKEFKDDMLPIIMASIECPTHTIVDAAMRSLPVVLPVLDFSTIKNELFPIVANVFSKTNSLAIKVRGLQAFVVLCGGSSSEGGADDGLNGLSTENKKTSSSSALDKFTMQEKIIPLLKAIKTKEPAVMVAALNVLRIVGEVADGDFVAMEILPILWNMSLGPLLNLKQFHAFMDLIKALSRRVEDEQTRKLQELSGSSGGPTAANDDFLSFGGVTGTGFDNQNNGGTEDDFEALVKGRAAAASPGLPTGNSTFSSWEESSPGLPATSNSQPPASSASQPAAFSWSTPSPTMPSKPTSQAGSIRSQQASFRTVTPDLARFDSLTPSATQFSQPLRPAHPAQPTMQAQPVRPTQPSYSSSGSINWSSAAGTTTSNAWSTPPSYSSGNVASTASSITSPVTNMSMVGQSSNLSQMSQGRASPFSLAPPPGGSSGGFGMAPPPPVPQQQQQQQQSAWGASGTAMGQSSMGIQAPPQQPRPQPPQQQKSGLDKYQSLI